MPGGLLTDLYELNMAVSYLRRGMTGPATFSLSVRRLPAERGFLIAVFAGEPLVEVTAPIAEAQLAETVLLNHITFQTSIASKAARCALAARGAQLVDFSFRRTQGIEAGLAVARASAIAGFTATSNTEAARRYGLTAAGTMAHSYVESFGSEERAFTAFAEDFPGSTTFLVDTYDTEQGVRTAIDVALRLRLPGPVGVRLDSGDLAALAVRARRLLDDAGLPDARIFASGGLDEHAIAALVARGAPIDAYGVGTKMGVSADAPYLDGAYKLVAYRGRPVMKLSQGKATWPGAKQVHRGRAGDQLSLREESGPRGHEPLLTEVMRDGRRLGPPEPLAQARRRCAASLAGLPATARTLRKPTPVPVTISPALAALRRQLVRDLRGRLDAEPRLAAPARP
ncbi:MAG TPA: nicotinate phosphoribosyltransferase [Streptosporangiaceae bacterium]|nr:nicotinate phosphoribosyltransferase [Streptosporangiaceae bacterium]